MHAYHRRLADEILPYQKHLAAEAQHVRKTGLRREVAEGERWRKARAADGRARIKETACVGRVVEPREVMMAIGGDGERGPEMRTGVDAPAVVRDAPWRRLAVELQAGVIALET